MRLPKIDLIPGTDQDVLILAVVAASGVFIASGGGTIERWQQAARTGGPVVAALYYGKKRVQQVEDEKFEKGFNTFNPALHGSEVVPFDAVEDLPLDPPAFRGNGEPDMPLGRAVVDVVKDVAWRNLQDLTVAELKDLARGKGMGGSWLSTARKAEIVSRLL